MAHVCPECRLICHCGGDIDDIVYYDTREESLCTHCPDCDNDVPYDE